MSNCPFRRLYLASYSLAIGTLAATLTAQAPRRSQSVEQRYTAPIELFKTGLGRFSKPISTANKDAQAFFDQGFQMMDSFAKPEAVRSFRESWKRDPDCAICYWGEAWAWGAYLNAPMTAEESPYRRAVPARTAARHTRPQCAVRQAAP